MGNESVTEIRRRANFALCLVIAGVIILLCGGAAAMILFAMK